MCFIKRRLNKARCWWTVVFVCLVTVVAAQDWRTEDNGRRITNLEAQRLDARISVVERRQDTVETLLFSILIVVIGQLIMAGVAFKQGRKGGTT